MTKMYFCYERNAYGWSPVVYHRDKPTSKVERTPLRELTEEHIDSSGEPMFGRLQAIFPPPTPTFID